MHQDEHIWMVPDTYHHCIPELHLESSDALGERKPQPLVETQKNLENLKQTPDTFSESQIWLFGSAV